MRFETEIDHRSKYVGNTEIETCLRESVCVCVCDREREINIMPINFTTLSNECTWYRQIAPI